ncbi:12516_t:CDS:2, partial [Dentiscutata erythropus]
MSSIENYTSAQYELEHVTSDTELKFQSLVSITSSINDDDDLATPSRKRRSKLFSESLFEERDLPPEHPKIRTHREIVCLLCSEDKRKAWLRKNDDSSTTNLWRHLERYHPNSNPRSSKELSTFTQLAFRKLLNKWIVLDNQPFTAVENKHFRKMIKLLNPIATIPTGDTIRNNIIKSYKDESIDIKFLLQRENLCDAFVSSCHEFGILPKIFTITSDNATNNDTFMQHLENICYNENIAFNAVESHCRCVAHIINLVVQDILKQFKAGEAQTENAILDNINTPIMAGDIIPKLRKLVVKIRSSPQRRERFMRQVKAAGLENCNLILDIKTRWNSTYEMLVRALEMHEAINAITYLDKDLQSLQLDIDEWDKIREVVIILEIFVRTTKMIESAKYPMLASIIPIYNYLIDELIKHRNNLNHSYEIITAVNAGLIKLESYYSRTNNTAIYIIATVLDPRLKLGYYEENDWNRDFINGIKATILQIYQNNYESSSYEATKYDQDDM